MYARQNRCHNTLLAQNWTCLANMLVAIGDELSTWIVSWSHFSSISSQILERLRIILMQSESQLDPRPEFVPVQCDV